MLRFNVHTEGTMLTRKPQDSKHWHWRLWREYNKR